MFGGNQQGFGSTFGGTNTAFNQPSTGFGAPAPFGQQPNTFGQSFPSTSASSTPFGGGGAFGANPTSSFGGGGAGGFGAGTNNFPTSTSTFGGPSNTFATTATTTTPFGVNNNVATPFGGGSNTNFGGARGGFAAPTTTSGLFGGGNTNTATSTFSSPFQQRPPTQGGVTTTNFGMQPGQEGHNPGNENELKREDRPNDSITSIRFTPNYDQNNQFFCLSSWDSCVRLYQYIPSPPAQQQGGFGYIPQQQQQPPIAKAMINLNVPVLDTCFKTDGTVIFTGNIDGTVSSWNLSAGQTQATTIGRHDTFGVKNVSWINDVNLLATAGWDGKIRYWDTRQPNPAETISLNGKIHAMTSKYPYLVAACGGGAYPVYLFDLRNPKIPIRDRILSSTNTNSAGSSPKMAIRSVALSTDRSFYACAGVEGRVHIQFVDEAKKQQNFTFRGHKTEINKNGTVVKYHNPINDIQFHPQSNVIATCGSDGSICFWDQSERSRLHYGPQIPASSSIPGGKPQQKNCTFPGGDRPAPVLCSSFNADGSVFAYAVGYDWSQGAAMNILQQQVNTVVFHVVSPTDLKKKQ